MTATSAPRLLKASHAARSLPRCCAALLCSAFCVCARVCARSRYAKIYLCDSAGANCQLKCTTGVVEGQTVTWNYCCSLGMVTAGQYAKVETWDQDWAFSDHDLGGHAMVLLEPGGTSGGTLTLTGLGEHTTAGSTVDVTVAASWS
eukprot:6675324-Prymnesium_polylepis.1